MADFQSNQPWFSPWSFFGTNVYNVRVQRTKLGRTKHLSSKTEVERDHIFDELNRFHSQKQNMCALTFSIFFSQKYAILVVTFITWDI